MSFKVEIEIDGCGTEYCKDCNIDDTMMIDYCLLFDKQRVFKKDAADFCRLPECLEAEKKYKEKENA